MEDFRFLSIVFMAAVLGLYAAVQGTRGADAMAMRILPAVAGSAGMEPGPAIGLDAVSNGRLRPAQDGGRKVNPKGSDKSQKKSGKKPPGPVRFIWPISGRKIVKGYGEQTNPRTGTVTVNPGINIAARSGTAVNASERGTVSLISWLPSYGTIVIIQHRDGYRTVYGNLASASVSKGAAVTAGQRIGSVGVVLGGAFLHFEVWRDQTRLDPLTVLPK